MDIDNAYKVFLNAKSGNMVSAVVYNEWAVKWNMPLVPDPVYDPVNTYDDFYELAYMNNFID